MRGGEGVSPARPEVRGVLEPPAFVVDPARHADHRVARTAVVSDVADQRLRRVRARGASGRPLLVAVHDRPVGGHERGAHAGAAKVNGKGAARLHLADGSTVEAERLLVAVGRSGAIDGLGLDAAGIETARGFIATDDTLATTAKGVWAVGDVTGRLQFTHAADEMGRIAAANALGRSARRRFRADAVPSVTFTDPEVAQVGSTEADAADHGGRVAYLPMSEVDRAIAAQETFGFVKLIAGPRRLLRNAGGGRVLGATIVASRAGEMIHEPALAMRTGMFTGRLAQTVHAIRPGRSPFARLRPSSSWRPAADGPGLPVAEGHSPSLRPQLSLQVRAIFA